MSLGKRFLHGAGVGLTEHVLRTVALFITTPLMVKWLGNSSYGYWLTAMSVVSYFSLLDLGMAFGATRFLSQAVGAKDPQRVAVIFNVACTHFRRASVIIGVGSLLVFICLPLTLKDRPDLPFGFVLAATIPTGLSMALRFWWRMPQLLLRAWVRYDLLSLAAIIRVLFQSTGLMVMLPLTGKSGLLWVGLLNACSELLELTLQNRFAKSLPAIEAVGSVDPALAEKERQALKAFTRDLVVGNVGQGVRANVGPQVTSYLFGLTMVPIYSTGIRLISMAEDVINTLFGGSLLSVFGQLKGSEDLQRLNKEFSRIITITAGFSAAAVGGLVIFGKAFMRRWLGEGFDQSYDVMVVLAVPYALYFMQYPSHSLFFTLGWQRQLMWVRCMGGLFAGLAVIVFGLTWGFMGVAWGSALEMALVYAIAFPILVHRASGIPAWRYGWNLLLWPAMKGLALPLIAGIALRPFIVPVYLNIFACAAVYAALMVISMPLFLLDKEGRGLLWKALKR